MNIVVKVCEYFSLNRDRLNLDFKQQVYTLQEPIIIAPSYREESNSYLLNTNLCEENHLILPSGYQISLEDVHYICVLSARLAQNDNN